jgi:hypothetical protein
MEIYPPLVVGKWKQVSGLPALITDTASYNTSVSGLLSGNTYRFSWTITGNGLCSSSSDTIEVTIWPPTSSASAGNDTTICDMTSSKTILLHANQPSSNETGRWNVVGGPGGSFGNASEPGSTFTFSQAGVYKLTWRISNNATGSCPANEDTLSINAYRKPVAGPIIPTSPSICIGDSVTISYGLRNEVILKWQYNPTPSNPGNWLDMNINLPMISFRNVQNTFAVRVLIVTPGPTTGCSISDTSSPVIVNVNTFPALSIKCFHRLFLSNLIIRLLLWRTLHRMQTIGICGIWPTKPGRPVVVKKITYTYADTGTFKVKLLVTDQSSACKGLDSVSVKILYVPGYLYIPNAICIGCSNNSLRQFLPLGKGLKDYRLRIFSKWGKLLFETTNLNPDGSPNVPWHGDFSNAVLQQDAFMWVCEARFI